MDLILREGYWIQFYVKLIAVISTTITTVTAAVFVNWYNNRPLPLIRQVFLIPNRISEFMAVGMSC
jgi:hypothetical protein